MRVKREVQVLSELGHRWSTPVFKHMQIGLALILAAHKKRKHTHLYIYICKYHCHIFVRKHRSIMLPSWLLTGFWLCSIFWEEQNISSNMSEKLILATLRLSHWSKWEKASAGTNSGVVWGEAVWSRLSELIGGSQSDICLNYTGKSQDTARTDGESSLFPSHAPTHTNTPCFWRPAVWCAPKLNSFPSLGGFALCEWLLYISKNIENKQRKCAKHNLGWFLHLLLLCSDQTWVSLQCW